MMQLGRTPRRHGPSALLNGSHLSCFYERPIYGAPCRQGLGVLRRRRRQRGRCVTAAAVVEVHLGVLSLLRAALSP